MCKEIICRPSMERRVLNVKKIRARIVRERERRLREQVQKTASRILAQDELAALLHEANAQSSSTGVSDLDYAFLFNAIKQLKPRNVLECGTGKSTWVIALAMQELERTEPGYRPLLISMEHSEFWHRQAQEIFPFDRFPFVDIRYSPETVWGHAFLRGTVYQEVPDHPYDFVLVDGPGQAIDGVTARNMDFVRIVLASDRPVSAIVDSRKSTMVAYSVLFGPEKVRFNYPLGLGLVDPVSKADVLLGNTAVLKRKVFPRLVKRDDQNLFETGLEGSRP